ncbi:MAG: maleylpyruvate isomerase family mycothiol-dependent enzyme [Propionibacteriales bacterium]|nr:maleylpyruvate isomerase family mycothiol-dependent enzyme [Propionibacteriales bacterium]
MSPLAFEQTFAILPRHTTLPDGTDTRPDRWSGYIAHVTPDMMLAQVDSSTRTLLAALSDLTDADVAAPSLLPGWTRGHVLTHIARNADALGNLLTWARTGDRTPMYPSRAVRNADIEAGAGRSAAAQRDDIARAHTRFLQTAEELDDAAWQHQVVWGAEDRGGPAAQVPTLRVTEVELHHTDLGLGHAFVEWPCELVKQALPYAAENLDERASGPIRLVATDTWGTFEYGASPTRTVEGPQNALLAWVTGRADGSGLAVVPEGSLPEIGDWR